MADLSTLDETSPLDSEIIALGAARIRETRDAIKTSFDLEHALTGEHTYQRGTTAARPSPVAETALYINTERQIEQVLSGAWALLRAVKSNRSYTAATGSFAPGVTFHTLEDVNVSVSLGGFALLLFRCVISAPVVASAQQLIAAGRFHVDGSNVVEPTGGRGFSIVHDTGNSVVIPYMDFGIYNAGSGLAEGTHTFDYRMQFSLALGNVTVTHSEIIALII